MVLHRSVKSSFVVVLSLVASCFALSEQVSFHVFFTGVVLFSLSLRGSFRCLYVSVSTLIRMASYLFTYLFTFHIVCLVSSVGIYCVCMCFVMIS